MVIKKVKALQGVLKKRINLALVAAFAFVIALAWNEFIRQGVGAIVDAVGLTGQTWFLQLIAAIVTTFVGVIGIMYFSRE